MRGVVHLFVIGALLAAGHAGAATPRGGTASRAEEAKPVSAAAPVDPTILTKRLLGRFQLEGVIHHEEIVDFNRLDDAPPNPDVPGNEEGEVRGAYLYLQEWSQPVEGKGDCIDFSDGPGMQCVLNVSWPEMWRNNGKAQLGGVSDMSPAMILAGFTPSTDPAAVRILLVDKRGLAHPGALTLKNAETATASLPCVNLPGSQTCEQRLTISAKASATLVSVTLSTRVRFLRSKLDRKMFLDNIGDRREKATEWVEELLDVSFTLRPESRDTQSPEANASPAAQ